MSGIVKTKESADTKDMIVETFAKFDQNKDGKISPEELKRVLNAIAQGQFDDAAVEALLEASDTNKDGFIQYEEFVNWVTQDLQGKEAFQPLDKRGSFKLDYRKLLPERFQIDVSKRYDLDKMEIGAGGFGKVFIAKDKEFSDRKVAVKKIQKPSKKEAEISDLQKEIAVMKELDHPNICKLLATFEEGRNMYFIMELCEGGEVFDRIIETGFITERTSSIIVAQVASALAYAHDRGIAHRDIKPENVVFCTKERDDLRVKLIDWGLATKFSDEGGMTKAVGSMTYAAPEVISSQDRRSYTEACDLWSMGVLTYVMLCGKPPFWGTREQHFKAAKNERYPFRDDPWDRMNPQAKDFVKQLLKAKPENRLKIKECVTHPWLATPPAETSECASGVLANLKNYSAQSTFSRMCITAVARQLDHKHLKDIHQVFRSMDKDGNGVLSIAEVTEGIKALGGDASNVQQIFHNIDMDGSNQIDYTEFCAAGLGEKTSLQNDVIWAAFKTFDVDNTGDISVENLRTILDNADVQDVWSADVCKQVGEEVIAKFDKDGDNRIGFEDWRELMTRCWTTKKAETPTGKDAQRDSIGAYDILLKVSELPEIKS